MILAGVSSVVFGMLVLIGALAGFIRQQMLAPLLVEIAVGATLLTAGWRAWREPGRAGFIAAIVTFLAAMFFGYRFFDTGQLVSGLLLLAGFASLFAVLLGTFLAVQRNEQ